MCLLIYDFDRRYPKLKYGEFIFYIVSTLVIGILFGIFLTALLLT